MARFHVLKLLDCLHWPCLRLDCLHWPCLRWGQGTLCRHPHQDRLAQNMAGAEDHTELVNIDEPRTTGKPWKTVFQPSPLVRIISYNCLTYLTFPNRSTSRCKTVWVWRPFLRTRCSQKFGLLSSSRTTIRACSQHTNHPGMATQHGRGKTSMTDTMKEHHPRIKGRIIPNNPKMMIEYD